MRQDDAVILNEIQKNTKNAMTTIDTLLDKVTDDDFSRQLSRQAMRYSQIHNDAMDMVLEKQGNPYRGNVISDAMLKSSLHANTALNISTEHLAELMIRECNREMTNMWRTVKHNSMATQETMEVARELMEFEKYSIERYRTFL